MIKVLRDIANFLYFFFKKAAVKDRISFISRQSNEKSIDFQILEQELQTACPTTELVFLCKTVPKSVIGKIGYAFHLLRQMRVIATSRAVILDSYCFGVCALKQRETLTVIQIWHAMGALKKIGWSAVGKNEGRDPRIAKALGMHANYTCFTVSSEACIAPMEEGFGYGRGGPNSDGRQHALIAPLPRIRLYTDADYIAMARQRVLRRFPEWKNETVIVYAPTFRAGRDISDEIRRMKQALIGYRLVVKKHPLMELPQDLTAEDCDFSTFEIMCAADYILLDYSAAVFDAVLLEKPLIFYPFDFDEYADARGFYLDYMCQMPGPIAKDPEELAQILKNAPFDKEKIIEFRKKWVDTSSAGIERLIDLLRLQ